MLSLVGTHFVSKSLLHTTKVPAINILEHMGPLPVSLTYLG